MSSLVDTCDSIIACTHAILNLIESESESPELTEISTHFEKRTLLFSNLTQGNEASRSPSDTKVLTQLAKQLRPLDAKILTWMQKHQESVAMSLRKAQQETQRTPSEARILIQDA